MDEKLTKPQKTLLMCSAFITGTGIALAGDGTYVILTSLVLLLLLSFLLCKKYLSPLFALICIAVYVFSVFYTGYRTPEPDGLYSLAPKKLSMRGKVVNDPRDDLKSKTKFYFKVDEIYHNQNWIPLKAKTIVYIYDKHRKFDEIKLGDRLELKGSVNPPYLATNPGEFDYGKYLNRKGIFTMTFVRYDNYSIVPDLEINLEFFLGKLNDIREKILNVHRKYLESPKIEILGGMVFGDHAVPAPDYVEKSFIKSGLLHLLAASGLNVGIIFGIWFFLASRAGLPFKLNIIVGMLLVGVYSLLTGLPPSITRAALMLEFILLGKLLDRQADNAILLVMVGALMLLFDPLMIANVSFQLSFIVTLGLLTFVPVLVEKSQPVPQFLAGAFWVPFVAQVFVAPIQAFHFKTFAPYSILANMLVVPFVGIISSSGFAGSILALIPLIGEKLCFLSDKIAEPFISLLLFISNFIAGLPDAILYIPKPNAVQITLFYSLLFIVFIVLKTNFAVKKHNIAVIILFSTLIMFTFKGSLFPDKRLEFMFFDVGEGDSALIKTPSQKYFLVDAGPPGNYSPAKTAIIPYLRKKGITKLNALVLTHPDNDHTGGTSYILENIGVDKLFHNGVKRKTYNYLKTQKTIDKIGVKSAVLLDKEKLNIDKNLQITVIRPEDTNKSIDNEDSLMLYIVYKDFSALLMADCEANSLSKLKNIVNPPVDLLKVGHHGSYNSVNEESTEYLNPGISVISVGKKGYHQKHPHPEVIRLLKQSGSKIFRTDRDFAVKISTDGYKIDYTTYERDKRMRL